MEMMYRGLFIVCLAILVIIILIYLFRSVIGPELSDRILAVNAIGTLTIIAISILSVWKGEAYLLDVAMVYAMLSFLALIVLTSMVTRENLEEQRREARRAEKKRKKAEKMPSGDSRTEEQPTEEDRNAGSRPESESGSAASRPESEDRSAASRSESVKKKKKPAAGDPWREEEIDGSF